MKNPDFYDQPENQAQLRAVLLNYVKNQLGRFKQECRAEPFELTRDQWLPIARNFIEASILEDLTSEKSQARFEEVEDKKPKLLPLSAIKCRVRSAKIEILSFIQHLLEHPEQGLAMTECTYELGSTIIIAQLETLILTTSLAFLPKEGSALVQFAEQVIAELPEGDRQTAQVIRLDPVKAGFLSAQAFASLQGDDIISVRGFETLVREQLNYQRDQEKKTRAEVYGTNGDVMTPLALLRAIVDPEHPVFCVLNEQTNLLQWASEHLTSVSTGDTTVMKGFQKLKMAAEDGVMDLVLVDEEFQPAVTSDDVVRRAMEKATPAEREKFIGRHYYAFTESQQFQAALKQSVLDLFGSEKTRYAGMLKDKLKAEERTIVEGKVAALGNACDRIAQGESVVTVMDLILNKQDPLLATLWVPRGSGDTPEVITNIRDRRELVNKPGRAHLNVAGQVELELSLGRKAKALLSGWLSKLGSSSQPVDINNSNNEKGPGASK